MTKVIAAINQKGGVGKTTTIINIATALVSIDKKVLIVDIDSQGNATTGLGVKNKDNIKTISEVLGGSEEMKDVIIKTNIPGLDIAPANINLSPLEVVLSQKNSYEASRILLRIAIDRVKSNYDFVLIDCPPSLGMLSINGMCASDSIIVPVQCEFFALEGLGHLLKTYKMIKQKSNPRLEIEGILLTMYDKRNKLSLQVEKELRNSLKDLVYDTIIHRNVKIAESSSHGKPVMLYDPECIGSECYIRLAKELIKRNNIEF